MRFVFLILLFVQLVPVFADSSEGWTLVDDSEKLKLFNKERIGSEIKEVKAVAYIQGTIKEAVEILFDRLNHPKIFKYIKDSALLKKDSICDWSYNVIDAPMASDRDYLVKSCEVKNSDASVSVTWEPFEDAKYPVNDKKVRVLVNQGYWKFKQIKPDELAVEYYIYTDPAGSLPLWIKNLANKKAVPDAIETVQREILKRRKAGNH